LDQITKGRDVKISLARAPLLVPFLCVAACTTSPEESASLSAAVAPAEQTVAEAPSGKARRKADRKLDQMATRRADQGLAGGAAQAQSVRPDGGIASEVAALFQRGRASWYGPGFDGRRTASGERFEPQAMTAAHRSLPFGTRLRVVNESTGRSVVVRINDRGPFHGSRLIDVSREAADQLGFRHKGMAKVRVRVVDEDEEDDAQPPVTAEAMEETLRPTLPVEVVAQEVARAVAPETTPPPAGAAFAIQVGAFSKKGNAERASSAVASTGPVTVKPLELRGLTLHRVLVGAWPDEKSAKAALDDVAAAGFPDAQVVRLN
jgi:rare lipoprotein A